MNEPQDFRDPHVKSPWSSAATLGIFTFLALCLGYQAAHYLGLHPIRFYPGLYRHVPLISEETLSAAMHAVHTASDAKALDAAIARVQKRVADGDADAAFRLGRYYHLERAEPDYALALTYYGLAVEQNHGWAINNMGLLYRDGLGVEQSRAKAIEYFQRAARENNPWAYVNLADMTNGEGHPLAWLEQGAANRCTLCLIEEAAAYHSGQYGVRRNTNKTIALLNEAAALGDAQAALIVAEMGIVGDGVPQSSATSFKVLKSLSDQGFGAASNLLGELSADDKIRDYLFVSYLGGPGQIPADLTNADAFPQNPAAAIDYWELASQQGNCQALINLSLVYDRGVGVEADPQQAADYVKRGLRCDPTNSFYLWKMAKRFFDAKGIDQDCESAQKLFGESLDQGYADAAVDLGYIYDKGCGSIARDDDRAFKFYLLGAKLGVALAQNNVGAMLKHGRGVAHEDLARGYGWQKIAALGGDELAKSNLEDSRFTLEIRVTGLANMADIQARLMNVPADHKLIMEDPWY